MTRVRRAATWCAAGAFLVVATLSLSGRLDAVAVGGGREHTQAPTSHADSLELAGQALAVRAAATDHQARGWPALLGIEVAGGLALAVLAARRSGPWRALGAPSCWRVSGPRGRAPPATA